MKAAEYLVRVQRVIGDGSLHGAHLTYRYDSPLRVGDRVFCPATEFTGPFVAQVTALGGGDFGGYIKPLLCRVAPDRKKP